jgi:uncharacterized protein DUF3987
VSEWTECKDEEPKKTSLPPSPPFPKFDRAALHGLAGEFVEKVEPHSEAHPAALLVGLLAAFGNLVGRHVYARAEADQHHGNIFASMVGLTSKGRKGTSWGHILRLSERVDSEWATDRIVHGLSSGEGLIAAVRDPTNKDEGISDKRLMVVESEMAGTLQVLRREGNTLSSILRAAWDSGSLSTLTKNPMRATGAHVSILAHVTKDEIRNCLRSIDIANGFANRFLWVAVERSKVLPDGGKLAEGDLAQIVALLKLRAKEACDPREIERDEEAKDLWRDVYEDLSEGRPGVVGAVTARAEAQVLRLALLYSLLDGADEIEIPHLEAALAIWRYCEDSALWIFGTEKEHQAAEDHVLIEAVRRRGGRATVSTIARHGPRRWRGDPDGVEIAFRRLAQAGLGTFGLRENGVGRPTYFFALPGSDSMDHGRENGVSDPDPVDPRGQEPEEEDVL